MFNEIKYEDVLKRVLDKVPPHIDKRPGSLIYMAAAPVCYEIYQYYMNLDWTLDQVFAKTQNYDYLKQNAAQYGIYPVPATAALIEGKFDVSVPVGTRFRLEDSDLIFKSTAETEKRSDDFFYTQLSCEVKGKSGNIIAGRLIPINYVRGLKSSTCSGLLIPGDDSEPQREFLERFLKTIKNEPFGWNEAQYVQQVTVLPGVGQCRVIHHTPTSATDFNVYVYITDTENKTPSAELVTAVQTYLEDNVPHTHNPSVIAAVSENPTISATVFISDTVAWAGVKTAAEDAIKTVIENVTKTWGNTTAALILRTTAIITALYDIDGVVDVQNVEINGSQANFTAQPENIINAGTITVTQGT